METSRIRAEFGSLSADLSLHHQTSFQQPLLGVITPARARQQNDKHAEIDDRVYVMQSSGPTARDVNSRKKCDETKPQCLRCLSSGRNCSYEYVQYPESESHRVMRTKPGPRTTTRTSSGLTSSSSSAVSGDSAALLPAPSISQDSAVFAHSNLSETWRIGTYPHSSPATPWGVVKSTFLTSATLTPFDISSIGPLSAPLDARLPNVAPQVHGVVTTTPGITSQTLVTYNLQCDEGYDNDPEGIRELLLIAPAMDKNVQDNSLPFVLQCYSEWAIVRVFEPLKLVSFMRDQVIQHFSSEDTRIKTILIANVMNKFGKHLKIDGGERSILDRLALAVRKSGTHFISTPTVPTLDRENAMRILDSMLEIFSLRTVTQSMATCFQSLDDAAPIFRRACTEPPGQPIDLTSILLNPNLNLRHFVTTDIVTTVIAGLPTYFQYKVPFSLELCEQMYHMQDEVGLQWLHGFPDQFVMLIAWINSLRETPGAGDNAELIGWIENTIPQIRLATSQSSDPVLRIGRMVVQECWRWAVYIYLYMALCEANACDPRVVRAQKGFMRLVRAVAPARSPDAFLFTPIVVAGYATIEEQDRNVIRQRILGLPECAVPGTVGNDFMLMLEDVWARTMAEGRVAVWSDSRLATFRVTGR
ncbi:unnamed protein product [Rhizoctonia solani]|uniref:Uncharacterized protein n=1 Tax=Rhizoctonia solani TaxID=456999 RepID=A0A8H3A130_9AGAM|nr:unnamed protein product [Rhizoctonia solani]